jgi:molybdenum cofactor biosynthesis enzyme MoaA
LGLLRCSWLGRCARLRLLCRGRLCRCLRSGIRLARFAAQAATNVLRAELGCRQDKDRDQECQSAARDDPSKLPIQALHAHTS